MENSNKDLYKHLGWAIELLECISDKFASNKDIPKQVFLEMERIKKDLCTRQISQNPYPIRILPS